MSAGQPSSTSSSDAMRDRLSNGRPGRETISLRTTDGGDCRRRLYTEKTDGDRRLRRHAVDVTDHGRATGHLPLSDNHAPGQGGSVAEWLACWTQAQKGPGTNRSRDAVG